MDENIASNWDLYLITILTLVLGMIIYYRRPPTQDVNNQNNNNNENNNQNEPEPDRATPSDVRPAQEDRQQNEQQE